MASGGLNQRVVPANAGTHSRVAHCWKRESNVRPHKKTSAGAYASLHSQGRRECLSVTSDAAYARSRGALRPRLLENSSPPVKQRAQGRPGPAPPAVRVQDLWREKRTRAYRYSPSIPAFPAQGSAWGCYRVDFTRHFIGVFTFVSRFPLVSQRRKIFSSIEPCGAFGAQWPDGPSPFAVSFACSEAIGGFFDGRRSMQLRCSHALASRRTIQDSHCLSLLRLPTPNRRAVRCRCLLPR